jgi:hypothetical protein
MASIPRYYNVAADCLAVFRVCVDLFGQKYKYLKIPAPSFTYLFLYKILLILRENNGDLEEHRTGGRFPAPISLTTKHCPPHLHEYANEYVLEALFSPLPTPL